MKHLIKLLFLFAIPAMAQTAPTTLTGTWTNTDAAWGPACPTTAPKSCLGPSILTDITSLTPVILLSNIGFSATTATFTFTSSPTTGNHTYSLVATGFDANGNAVKSGAATTVVDIENTLNKPTGWTVTVQ